MENVYIVSGARTAVGNFQGQFQEFEAHELGAFVVKEVMARAPLNGPVVDQVIMGQTLTAGKGQNPARRTAVSAGLPPELATAFTVNMLCGSGLKAICLGYQAIKNGDCEVVICGGQESMTRSHHSAYFRKNKMGNIQLGDTLLVDGLTDAMENVHMGKTAEHLAAKYEVTREAQDTFAWESQMKTKAATQANDFKEEIVAVSDKRTGKPIITDEFPKPNTTVENLAALRPAFQTIGTVTAGNSSGINDGAAAVALCSQTKLAALNLKPLAKIIGFTEAAVSPMEMGLGPVKAVEKLMPKIGWTHKDVDLYEMNEAFAVQSILVNQMLDLDKTKVNISGGALALGHPIGASGARIVVTLLYNLKRQNKKRGIAALCIGGGMGIAIALEMC